MLCMSVMINTARRRCTAVSYTHLDVYKRQIHDREMVESVKRTDI